MSISASLFKFGVFVFARPPLDVVRESGLSEKNVRVRAKKSLVADKSLVWAMVVCACRAGYDRGDLLSGPCGSGGAVPHFDTESIAPTIYR